MREQTSQSLGSQIPYDNGVSVSIPLDGLGVTHVGSHGMVAGVSGVVDAGIRSSALGSSNFRGFIPGLSSTDTSTMGVSVTGAASPILNSGSSLHMNRPSLSSSTDQCQLEFPVSVPVQVPNVDGSVSAFGSHSDMREQTSQSLGSQIPYDNGVSVSIPLDGLGVTHVGSHGMVAGVSGVVDAGIRSSALGSSNFRGFIPGLSSTDTSTMGVSVTGAASPILNSGSSLHMNRPSLSSSTDQCQLEFPVSVPVQVPNVDGSVSAFGSHSVMHPSYVGPPQPQMGKRSFAGQSMFPNNPSLGHTPMVLDFSTGCVICVSDPASSNPGSDAQQRATPARPSRRAGMRSVRRARQHTTNANSHAAASDDPPVFGPVAPPQRQGAPLEYKSFGRCDRVCQHCGAVFWLGERRAGLPMSMAPQYQRCCAGGRAVLRSHNQYPAYITQLFADRHFMENIRAYNQMFAMTSFGATIDNSLNMGRGPYVFRVSGQIYHWIGGFCLAGDDIPRFLQLYIYDTEHEVRNRLSHFEIYERHALREPIIQGLIEFLDSNNALVKLFRTARDKLREAEIPNFSIRLFGVVGSNQYELPAGDGVGAIVYEGGPETATDYDVMIERHSGEPESKHGW
ncbi:hypothetical protein CTI12_AA491210 [Artemisia annua]|uniref:Helitron helicase-like domain-containing protein n=1 Tax=Artemisia annua TaxID=35608 RepID=A0A2U1LGV5_ARTAN|nr:hypothetical protein CTI12_AA491210 [Artemisia annua]